MKRLRRTFTTEFKHEAACLVLDQGYSYTEAARSLSICSTAIRTWVSQLQAERGGSTPEAKALTCEQQRLQELEAQVNRIEREKSILKKATGGIKGPAQHLWKFPPHSFCRLSNRVHLI